MKKQTKICVIGGSGQLALQFKDIIGENKNWKFLDSSKLDITNISNLLDYFSKNKIDILINCAAYTDVEGAEKHTTKAYMINHEGVRNLLHICDRFKMKFIHFSTDYVYDGHKRTPYLETENLNPINFYGKTKLAGELEVLNSNVKSIIIRTSWLYSSFGNNFVINILKSQLDSELTIVNDQVGSPTYAKDLALSIIEILNNDNYHWIVGDTFNYSNEGFCSWYEFAVEISKIANLNKKIVAVRTSDLKSKVSRPKFTVMDKSKFKECFDVNINNWKVSLESMLKTELIDI